MILGCGDDSNSPLAPVAAPPTQSPNPETGGDPPSGQESNSRESDESAPTIAMQILPGAPPVGTFVGVSDDAGANDEPGQVDLTQFSRSDFDPAFLWVRFSWDEKYVWTGSGQTGDACALFDTDADGNANNALCVQITNDADGTVITQTLESPLLYECGDKKADRCSQKVVLLDQSEVGSTQCAVDFVDTDPFLAGDEYPGDTGAECKLDLNVVNGAQLTNVCSFPSGSPNSNPFDCVVTPGAAFLVVQKETIPDADPTSFDFTLNPPASDGAFEAHLADGESALFALVVADGPTFTVTETPDGWTPSVTCVSGQTTVASGVNSASITAQSGQTVTCAFTNSAPPDITVTKTANPTSVDETGANVTFTVTVTNNSAASVTLTSLTDDVFLNLNGKGDCATGGTIATGATYSCSFTEFMSGEPDTPHRNTVTATATNEAGSDTESDFADVTFTDVLPDIDVTKTANPTSVPETGGDVIYTVTVTNKNAESVTLNSLVDDVFGDLNGNKGDCVTGGTIAGNGGTYSCSFTETLVRPNGDETHENTVTATATDDDGNSDTATDSAIVTFTDVLPTITVTKTANPTSVPETGGNVEFTVVVTNNSAESVTLDAMTDSDFGDLDGKGDCATGGTIASGGSYSCSFTEFVSGDHSGPDHSNTVTATASDDDGNSDTATDSATVGFDDVLPDIDVSKTANKASVPETGGDVTFTVTVTNNNAEDVTLTSLTDDVFLNLNGKGDCATGGTIAGSGGTYSCSFTETLLGDASGPDHTNTVTATASDDDGNSDTATDSATVGFDDVLPDITLTKTVDPTTLPPAATVTSTPLTAQQILPGAPLDNTFLGVSDDAGANDEPGQVDLTQFSRSDVDPDFLWLRWSWDELTVWTGSGQTGDACALLDTNGNGNADNALCVQITNDSEGTTITQTLESPILYDCGDKKADRCSQKVVARPSSDVGLTECAVAFVGTDPFAAGDEYPDDTGAECKLDRLVINAPNLTNVCSFPSGSPNSNPFDCVVTPGAGFLVIQKATNPDQSGETFSFTVSPTPTTGNPYTITDTDPGPDQTAALIPVAPGTYSLTEAALSNWSVTSVTCNGQVQTFSEDPSTGDVTVSGIQAQSGQTVTCTFTNLWEFEGVVTYTIVVTNNGLEAVTLDTLTDTVDSVVENLNGVGDCSTGGTIAGLGSYSCSFQKTLTGQAGDVHTNEATGTASDNDGNSDTDSDTATVTFTGPV
jgi:hypothetical protein